ncbi:hypothetical protein K9M74_02000 [Candidatus Woesearchaeota archaeon]|nr:hypothetical protein [Candidatus Woesearchaeota archaeon]
MDYHDYYIQIMFFYLIIVGLLMMMLFPSDFYDEGYFAEAFFGTPENVVFFAFPSDYIINN